MRLKEQNVISRVKQNFDPLRLQTSSEGLNNQS